MTSTRHQHIAEFHEQRFLEGRKREIAYLSAKKQRQESEKQTRLLHQILGVTQETNRIVKTFRSRKLLFGRE